MKPVLQKPVDASRRNACRWLIVAVLSALALLLIPLNTTGRVSNAVMDLCHAPLFALLAGMFFGTVRSRPTQKPVWVWGLGIWGGLSAFGLFAEWLQNFVGRHPSWHDAIANSLGAAAGVLSMWPDAARRRGRLFRGIAVLLLLFAWATPFWILADAAYQAWQMPVLASFEWPGELSRWAVQDCQLQRVKKHQTAGDWALQVDLKAGIYPGLEMPEVPPGWTGYRELAFDVTLESPQSLSLIVKIYDEAHNLETEDRFHYRAELTAGLNRIRIPLSEVQHAPRRRLMDLARMQVLQFFTVKPLKPARIYLDNIRLIPD